MRRRRRATPLSVCAADEKRAVSREGGYRGRERCVRGEKIICLNRGGGEGGRRKEGGNGDGVVVVRVRVWVRVRRNGRNYTMDLSVSTYIYIVYLLVLLGAGRPYMGSD